MPYSSNRRKSIEALAMNIITHHDKELPFPLAVVFKTLDEETENMGCRSGCHQVGLHLPSKWLLAFWPLPTTQPKLGAKGDSFRAKRVGQPAEEKRLELSQLYKNTLYLARKELGTIKQKFC